MKYKFGEEPGAKKKSVLRKPDRLKSDGSRDERNWPSNSGHKKAMPVEDKE